MVPLFRRAYNQLKIKVRALPTWRNPVGEGAKRTRGLPLEDGFAGLGIESCRKLDRTRRWYGRPNASVKMH